VRHVDHVEEDRGMATGTGEACRSMSLCKWPFRSRI